MKKRKFFLDKKAKETRRKTLDELEKKDVRIEGGDQIVGGASDPPRWLETPDGGDPEQPGKP